VALNFFYVKPNTIEDGKALCPFCSSEGELLECIAGRSANIKYPIFLKWILRGEQKLHRNFFDLILSYEGDSVQKLFEKHFGLRFSPRKTFLQRLAKI
jgi:hypothetical protein